METKLQTNADRIRAMSDEELAEFLAKRYVLCTRCFFKRTCSKDPISYKAIADLEMIRPYEPNLVKAAWNIFGKSYTYRQEYNAYKAKRMEKEKAEKKKQEQEAYQGISMDDYLEMMSE